MFGSISSLCHFLISHFLLHFAYCSHWSCLMIGCKTPSYLHTYCLACFSDKAWTLIRQELPNYQGLRLSVSNWWPLLWLRNQAVTTQRVQTEEGTSSCKTWMKDTASTDRSEERGWQRACSRSEPVLLAVGIGLKQSNTSLAASCLYRTSTPLAQAVLQHIDTRKNTEAVLKCYMLNSYVGTTFSYDKLLA